MGLVYKRNFLIFGLTMVLRSVMLRVQKLFLPQGGDMMTTTAYNPVSPIPVLNRS
jgi:hypothetical protein